MIRGLKKDVKQKEVETVWSGKQGGKGHYRYGDGRGCAEREVGSDE